MAVARCSHRVASEESIKIGIDNKYILRYSTLKNIRVSLFHYVSLWIVVESCIWGTVGSMPLPPPPSSLLPDKKDIMTQEAPFMWALVGDLSLPLFAKRQRGARLSRF